MGLEPCAIFLIDYYNKDRMTLGNHDATDAQITLSDGSITRLSKLWEHGPLVLVFLRHFG